MHRITFSSCFYIIKSKFDSDTYVGWMNNLISIVNNFKLVIYTDEASSKFINTNNNPQIKIVIKPIHEFYCYYYKDAWIKNHEENSLLNNMSGWELNMLWSEKIHFVAETARNKYFDTDFYGWCDIGYFRNRSNDTPISELHSWPANNKIEALDKTKIHYACVNNNKLFINHLCRLVFAKLEIPPNQVSVAGGFFILHKNLAEWWKTTYYAKLDDFFNKGLLVKDDQIVVANCVFSDLKRFSLHYEDDEHEYDNWFMFQRLLM